MPNVFGIRKPQRNIYFSSQKDKNKSNFKITHLYFHFSRASSRAEMLTYVASIAKINSFSLNVEKIFQYFALFLAQFETAAAEEQNLLRHTSIIKVSAYYL